MYKVRGDESGAGMHQFPAQVIFLDDSAHRFCLDKKAKGADLLNLVFQVRYRIVLLYGTVKSCKREVPVQFSEHEE